MGKISKIFIIVIVVLISIALFMLFSVTKGRADNYSSDFEYRMMEKEQSTAIYSIRPQLDDDSPSARYNAVRLNQKYREILNEIYKRQKHTYRPYSNNVYQQREERGYGK